MGLTSQTHLDKALQDAAKAGGDAYTTEVIKQAKAMLGSAKQVTVPADTALGDAVQRALVRSRLLIGAGIVTIINSKGKGRAYRIVSVTMRRPKD